MKTSWEIVHEGRTHYIQVERAQVVVGSHYGSGMTDNAGTCTHEEFLNGRFQDLILQEFDKTVLDEVITAVKKAHVYPDFLRQAREIQARKDFLHSIPINKNLKKLLKDSKTINGFDFYGNKGSYKTLIESDSLTLEFTSTRGYIENAEKERIPIKFDCHASSVVELNDYFYIICGQNFLVLAPEGHVVYDSNNERVRDKPQEQIFGSWIRIERVYKNDSTIFVGYWWFGNEFNDGLIQYELDKGLIGHCEIKD